MLTWSPTSPERMNWDDAQQWCAAQGDGWRCPIIQELISIVDYATTEKPCVITSLRATTVAASYWSSTLGALDPSLAWDVDFVVGYVLNDSKFTFNYVRAVRGTLC